MKKIYIIGPVGSGKTTLANNLSKKLNIKFYELDKVVYDDNNNNKKRTKNEIEKIIKKIQSQSKWIVEDVGREFFTPFLQDADRVYYLNIYKRYLRCIKRWLKQKLGIEKYNYKPTIKSLIECFGWIKKDEKQREQKLLWIKKNSSNYEIIKN